MRGAELWPPPIWGPLHEHTERAIATRRAPDLRAGHELPGAARSVREWTVVPLVGPERRGRRILAMSHDVTAQRRLVDELREADRRKSEFIAVLSHELRNPLAAIRTSLTCSSTRAPGSEAVDASRADHRSAGRPAGAPGRRSARRHAHHPEQDPAAAPAAGPQRGGARDASRTTARTSSAAACSSQAGLATRADLRRTRTACASRRWSTNLLANAVKFTPRRRDGDGLGLASDAGGRRRVLARDRHRRGHRSGAAPAAVRAVHAGRPHARRAGRRPRARAGAGQGAGRAARRQRERAAARARARAPSSSCASRSTAAAARRRAARRPAAALRGAAAGAGDRGRRRRRRRRCGRRWRSTATRSKSRATAPTASRRRAALEPDVVLCDIGLPGMDGYEVARRVPRATRRCARPSWSRCPATRRPRTSTRGARRRLRRAPGEAAQHRQGQPHRAAARARLSSGEAREEHRRR